MSSAVAINHLVFAAAVLGLSMVLVVVVMTTIFLRHLSVLEDPSSGSRSLLASLRLGGIAIVGAFLAGITLIHVFGEFTPIKSRYFWGFAAALLMVSTISLFESFKPLSLWRKMAAQVFAISIVLVSGIVIDELHLPWVGWIASGLWAYPLTLVWILGLTNVYNLMDRVEGLAASNAVIASAFFCYISFQQQSVFIYLCSVVLFASSLGFLAFNWPPARILMGDVGGTFLGFSFAVMAIIAALYDRSHTSLFVVPMLLFHFIFDAAFTLSIRFLTNLRWQGGSYFCEKMIQLKYSRNKILLVYAGAAIAQGFVAILMVNIQGSARLFAFLPFLTIYGAWSYWVYQQTRRMTILVDSRP